MRFTIGQTYVFFAALSSGKHTPREKAYAYIDTNPDNQLLEMKFIRAKCVEHHKVSWDQDPNGEEKYDGFIFELEDGMRGTNQYPHASYGQMSDAGDGQLSIISSMYDKHDKDLDKIIGENIYLEYTLLTRHLSSLESAIYKTKHDGNHYDPARAAKLDARKADIETELANQLGMGVRYLPFEFRHNNGSTISPPGMFRCETYLLDATQTA